MISKRSCSAIAQYAAKNGLENRVDRALAALAAILPKLGSHSQSRSMVNRIGITLLQDTVQIVAPSCPDYSHEQGKYTFHSVGSGLPLLSQLHIAFLDTIVAHVPGVRCEIVVADQEADDAALCQQTGLCRDEFLLKIQQSIATTQTHLQEKSWTVSAMTTRFPDLMCIEAELTEEITNDRHLNRQITNDTLSRASMYQKIGVYDIDQMRRRTIRTASQYSALAKIAARDKLLVCNHETVNLGWYNRYDAAVLHNPISVY
jgi:hypothetical protein